MLSQRPGKSQSPQNEIFSIGQIRAQTTLMFIKVRFLTFIRLDVTASFDFQNFSYSDAGRWKKWGGTVVIGGNNMPSPGWNRVNWSAPPPTHTPCSGITVIWHFSAKWSHQGTQICQVWYQKMQQWTLLSQMITRTFLPLDSNNTQTRRPWPLKFYIVYTYTIYITF